MRRFLLATAAFAIAFNIGSAGAAEPALANVLSFPADSTDLTFLKKGSHGGANVNRQGFFSDLFYDSAAGTWFAISDRGPGGGLISYPTRVQEIRVDYTKEGVITGYKIVRTIDFKEGAQPLNGLSPNLLNDDSSILGLSFDPEGIVVGPTRHLFVSDEYGPSVYEFSLLGHFIRAFEVPANLLPFAAGTLNYAADPPTVGRQANRGYEGLALNASKTKLYAVMQDPLQNEGSPNGRSSRNVRIVEFDMKTGKALRQFIYQLDTVAEINARTTIVADQFAATAQGRNIGVSSIAGISDTQFLVLERDNRGRGVDNPTGINPSPLHKRVYRIDISGATDVSSISLAGTNSLPAGVNPVSKTPFLDMLAALKQIPNQTLPEKFEGLGIGPKLPNGKRLILVGTDNDYSVTQTGSGQQFDVCIQTNASNQVIASQQVPLDSGCPAGFTLIPAFLMAFVGDVN